MKHTKIILTPFNVNSLKYAATLFLPDNILFFTSCEKLLENKLPGTGEGAYTAF